MGHVFMRTGGSKTGTGIRVRADTGEGSRAMRRLEPLSLKVCVDVPLKTEGVHSLK